MFIIPFIIICIFDLSIITIFQKVNNPDFSNDTKIYFGKTLPFSLSLIIFILYISGFFNNLLIGLYCIYFLCILFIAYIVYLFFTKNEKNKYLLKFYKRQIATPSFFIFFLLYIAIFFYNLEASFYNFDEWMHWGPFIKDMFNRNKFYNTVGHIAEMHISYPPFITLFEYFYMKTVGNVYSMQNMYRANQILCYSFYIIILDGLFWSTANNLDNSTHSNNVVFKNLKTFFVGALCVLCFIFANRIIDFYANPIKSIYGDYLMSLTFAFLMISILKHDFQDRFKNINLVVISTLLLFSKQMGIALFLLSFFTLFIITLVDKNLTKANFIKGIIIFIIPLVIYFTWKIEVYINNVHDQFDNIIDLQSLINILFFNVGKDFQIQTKSNFVNWLFHKRQVGLTAFEWGIFFIVLTTIISFLQKEKYKNKIFMVSYSFIIGYPLYLFALLCLYLNNFGEVQSVILDQIWRYTSTYLQAIFIFVCYIFIEWVLYKNNYNVKSVFLLSSATLLLIVSTVFANNGSYIPTKKTETDAYRNNNFYETMQNFPANTKILIIYADGKYLADLMPWQLRYYSLGKNIIYKVDQTDVKVLDNASSEESNLQKNAFLDYIKTYDYIYFYRTNDAFWDNYGNLFNEQPKDRDKVYKVSEILR